MDVDDVDPAWLEACMAEVDSLPAANLHGLAIETQRRTGLQQNTNGVGHTTSNEDATAASVRRSPVLPASCQGSAVSHARSRGAAGVHSSLSACDTRTATATPAASAPAMARSSTSHLPYTGNGNSRARPSVSSSRPSEARQRVRGVGANPYDNEQQTENHGASETPDPCWRCGEAVRLMEFGNNRFFGCSSHPLCKATRKSRKNGAVVELIAEETRTEGVAAEKSSSSDTSGTSSAGISSDPTGITRCHLCVRVRGGYAGGAARAAWALLRRNGIQPLPSDLQGAAGGSTRGNIKDGGSRSDGTNISSTGVGTAEDVAGMERLKAVMELGKRDSVRRLLKQEGMAHRDIPQTTYSSVMACGAGDTKPSPAQARRGKGRAKKGTGSHLEPLDACEAMLYSLPVGLRDTLLPFQRDGVLYGLRRKGRCLIADEMGTGKTLQALGVMGCYREDWPLLIVAPASMRLMWAEEVEHWYPFLAPSEIHLIKGNKDKLYLTNVSRHLWPRVVVVSYFMLRMLADSIGKGDWNAVIFDESHMISTKLGEEQTQAQQVTVCLKVAQRAKRVVMLSGTPSLSKPFDLFNQVEALSPGLLMGKDRLSKAKNNFAANYCGGAMRGQNSRGGGVNRVAHISGSEYPDELHLLLKNKVMIRRLKINVVKQLPPLRVLKPHLGMSISHELVADPSDADRALPRNRFEFHRRIVVRVEEHGGALKRALKEGGFEADPDVEEDDDTRDQRGPGTAAGHMSDDQRAGLKKVKSASEWVVDKLAASQETLAKFVVFAHHKTVLDRLQEAFEVAGTPRRAGLFANRDTDANETSLGAFTCLRIDGSVPTSMRASRLSEFNNNNRCRVLVVSITAGGQGLDFTAASNVVFVELPESPAWLRQAEDRLHRRRQEKSVNVYLTVLPAGSHDDTRWLSLSEKLLTQTSVMNGTLDAENIDVDRVCDAGGMMDHDGPAVSPSSRRRQGRRRRNSSVPPQDLAEPDTGGGCTNDGSSGGLSDDAPCFDLSGGDDLVDDNGAGREADGVGGDSDHEMETDLDIALRNALVSTPSDVPTHRPSQSPTYQLLQAIAESPAPGILSQTASSAIKMKGKARNANGTAEGQISPWLGERKLSRPGTNPLEGVKGLGENSRNVFKTTTKEGRTASMASPVGMGRQHRREVFATPAVSRKRPRSSPESGGTASGSRSGNPFKAFGHRFRPPAPSPSSRLGVDGGSPKPPPTSPPHPGASGGNNRNGSTSAASGGSHNDEVLPLAGVTSCHPGAEDGVGVSVDLSHSADEDNEDFAMTPTPSRRRGAAEGAATPVSSSTHRGDNTKVSSPVLLVDLSQPAEEKASLSPEAYRAGSSSTAGERSLTPADVRARALSSTHPDENELRPRQEMPLGGATGLGKGNGDGSCVPAVTSSGRLGGIGRVDSDDFEPDRRDEESCVLGEGEVGRQGLEEEVEEQLLASKLYFLVSANTGRIHVYKKEDDRSGGLDDSFDDDEDGKPQHCRCNFRPEDLDRLFEAAKEARKVSTKTSTPSSSSTRRTTEACEAAAREALSTLPKLLRSPPALRVARVFVQEWRALSSRKRPLLKGIPCRPPLAEELSRVTPTLTGSTRRYADTAGGTASLGAVVGIKDSNGQVLCLFCEEEAASEQGPHVHRRDRFCSVECMEAHGTRTSNSSLRRLVLERDHGVCSKEDCGRDCLALVSRLKAVQLRETRRDILLEADPRFGAERNVVLRERLVRQPREGNAWNADHVTAVYQGGGECGVDNLRTLCVLCHSEITRVQTAERAAARRIAKENERRLVEEAQGQRRLVSFGGGIALSAGSSQGSAPVKGRGGCSPGDAFELSSDDDHASDDNFGKEDEDRGSVRDVDPEDKTRGDDDVDDDDDEAFVSPPKKAPGAGRVRHECNKRRGSTTSSAPVASRGGKLGRKGNLTSEERDAPRRSGDADGSVTSGTGLNHRNWTKKRSVRSSMEAFERIIDDAEFGLDYAPVAGDRGNSRPLSRDGGFGASAKSGEASREKGVRGRESDDECCEILFTRVRPAGNPSS